MNKASVLIYLYPKWYSKHEFKNLYFSILLAWFYIIGALRRKELRLKSVHFKDNCSRQGKAGTL